MLKNKRIIVVTHVYGTGSSQDLVRYLVEHKTKLVLFISHPLFYDPKLAGSGFDRYEAGNITESYHSSHRRIPLFIGFLLHAVKTMYWVLTSGQTWDLYIGRDR